MDFESTCKTFPWTNKNNNEGIYDHHIPKVDGPSFKQKDTQEKSQTLEVVETLKV